MRKVAYALAALLVATLLVEELRLADARSEIERRVEVLKRVEEHNKRMIERTMTKYGQAQAYDALDGTDLDR
jgi:hypothetical protein